MVFGKKKVKEVKEVKNMPVDLDAGTMDVGNVETPPEPVKEEVKLTPEQQDVLVQVENFQQQYNGVFTPDQLPGEAYRNNLLFGIFCELRKLNSKMGELVTLVSKSNE